MNTTIGMKTAGTGIFIFITIKLDAGTVAYAAALFFCGILRSV